MYLRLAILALLALFDVAVPSYSVEVVTMDPPPSNMYHRPCLVLPQPFLTFASEFTMQTRYKYFGHVLEKAPKRRRVALKGLSELKVLVPK